MKVAMVSPYDYDSPGGVTSHVSQLSKGLLKLGHAVHVLAPHSMPVEPKYEDPLLIPLGRPVPIPTGGSVARLSLSWWLSKKISMILDRECYDVIHVHEPLAPILPLVVLEHSKSVNIGTFHAYDDKSHVHSLGRLLVRRWQKKLHGSIAVSEAALSQVDSNFTMDYQIIPNGVDIDHFAVKYPPICELKDGKTNILFVGRLEKRKGLKYLIEAFLKLKRECPNIRLVVVGPGDLDKESQYIMGASNSEDILIAGRVSYEDLPRYYSSADIFCSPATGSESFGIVLLEAMASSKPVVASNILGYRSIIRDREQGLLFDNKDCDALVTALKFIITNPDLGEKMGISGRETVERYRWSSISKQVEEYYFDRISSVIL